MHKIFETAYWAQNYAKR